MRFASLLALAATLLLTAGCHSRYVEATVTNHTSGTIQLLEVDYPSASFGTQNLAPEGVFHYRFKVLGSGPTKLLYTDAAHKDHTSDGPALNEGTEGALSLDITNSAAQWKLEPKAATR
jgi:hypothetical protein